jgi:hypothetical protein
LTAPDLLEYYKLLQVHDWGYQKKGDIHIWKKGHLEREKLLKMSFISHEHRKLYFLYKKRVDGLET